jgi:hypothetical protein
MGMACLIAMTHVTQFPDTIQDSSICVFLGELRQFHRRVGSTESVGALLDSVARCLKSMS